MRRTQEGAKAHEHSLDHAVEFYSKAGSLYVNSGTYYGNEETALSLFQKVWIVEPLVAMKLLLWARDCRGGAGNRSGSRACLRWLSGIAPNWLLQNLHLIPAYGRWDDLRDLFGTPVEQEAAGLWAAAIHGGNILAAKWADRSDIPLQRTFETNEAGLRKVLAGLRKDHIIEAKMCSGMWSKIEYKHVPSVAMSRYNKAFRRHDEERYSAFKAAVKSGEAKVHASVLFPHDCVRTVLSAYGDKKDMEMGDLQFDALPNYMEGTNEKVLAIVDTSGSMNATISAKGMILRVDVAKGLALYCSAKIPKDNPFHKKFVEFCHEGKFMDWSKMSFSKAVNKCFHGAVGPTRIDRALMLILETATFFKMPQELLPTTLLILSDMQFHPEEVGEHFNYQFAVHHETDAHVAEVMKRFEQVGYVPPKIVFWNLAGYAGSPATCKMPKTALVSGFSPSVMKAILSGEDFTPRAVMLRALEKYEVATP
jgi:hypothetical protein